ncbi:MAG: DUF4920 domain-containing protein [Myxococcales bacterium]|nr:DUF4920 domain-containing protein [Myxococcales bacterium]MCB9669665.1 DUF4920 domain-containing protein [Alphaproteobacteria bacterium]
MFVFALLAGCATETPPAHPPEHAAREDHAHEAGHEGGHDDHHGATKAAVVEGGWSHYGSPFTKDAAAPCGELLAHPDQAVDTTVRVQGRIENVCQKAGCWMVLADEDGNYLRVTMKDHDAGVPTDTKTGAGTMADVEGTLVAKPLDPETLAHLKSEAKGDAEAVAKQLAPKYELVATGVSVKAL